MGDDVRREDLALPANQPRRFGPVPGVKLAILAILALAFFVLLWPGLPTAERIVGFVSVLLSAIGLVVLAWTHYVVDPDGVTVVRPGRRRRWPWSELGSVLGVQVVGRHQAEYVRIDVLDRHHRVAFRIRWGTAERRELTAAIRAGIARQRRDAGAN